MGKKRRIYGSQMFHVLRVELLWAITVDDPRDISTWRVRTRTGKRPLASWERDMILYSPPEDFAQAGEYRKLERELRAEWERLAP